MFQNSFLFNTHTKKMGNCADAFQERPPIAVPMKSGSGFMTVEVNQVGFLKARIGMSILAFFHAVIYTYFCFNDFSLIIENDLPVCLEAIRYTTYVWALLNYVNLLLLLRIIAFLFVSFTNEKAFLERSREKR